MVVVIFIIILNFTTINALYYYKRKLTYSMNKATECSDHRFETKTITINNTTYRAE